MGEVDTTSFIEELSVNGIAFPSRYSIQFNFPDGLVNAIQAPSSPALNRRLSIACRSAQFPSKYLEIKEQKIAGITRIYTDEQSFDNSVTLNFRLGKDHIEKITFETWQDLAVDPISRAVGYYDDYAKDCTLSIYQLDVDGSALYGSQMFEVFPTDIVDHNTNADVQDDYQRFSVTLAFSRYENIDVPGVSPRSIAQLANLAAKSSNFMNDSAGSPTLFSAVADFGNAIIPSKTTQVIADPTGTKPSTGRLVVIGGKIMNIASTVS